MLGYFGFLRAAEFTVPNLASFFPAIHLSVADLAVDSLQSPNCLYVRIKASKTHPFCQGCHIHIGLGRAPLHIGLGGALRTVYTLLALPLCARKCPWPLVPSCEWSTSVSLNLDRLAAANFLYHGDWRQFFQPQLPHWGCHGSCSQRYS